MPAPRLSPDVRLRLVTALAEGMSMVKACRLLRIGSTTVSNWRRADGAFSEEVSRARAAGELARAAARPAPKPRAPVVPRRTVKPPAPVADFIAATVAQAVPLIETPAPVEAPRATAAQPPSAPRPRDVRPTIPSSTIATAIVQAAGLIAAEVGKNPRFKGDSFAALRTAFHVLPDDVRREALARLVIEEAERIAHDTAASWTKAG